MHKKFGFWLHFVRVNLAFLVISVLWGLIGLGFLSLQLGAAFFLWSLVVGPLVISLTLYLFRRPIFGLTRLSFKKETALQHEFLECLLRRETLNLEIWVRPSDDLGLFWWEEGLTVQSKTHLVVTTRWLQESVENKSSDLRSLWAEISKMDRGERIFRTFEMAMWWGASSLFDFFLSVLRAVLDTFNFSDFPSPAFWMQRFAWTLHAFAFGAKPEGELLPRIFDDTPVAIPRAWNYIFFGVWVRYPSRQLHPTWVFFTSSSAFIFPEEVKT